MTPQWDLEWNLNELAHRAEQISENPCVRMKMFNKMAAKMEQHFLDNSLINCWEKEKIEYFFFFYSASLRGYFFSIERNESCRHFKVSAKAVHNIVHFVLRFEYNKQQNKEFFNQKCGWDEIDFYKFIKHYYEFLKAISFWEFENIEKIKIRSFLDKSKPTKIATHFAFIFFSIYLNDTSFLRNRKNEPHLIEFASFCRCFFMNQYPADTNETEVFLEDFTFIDKFRSVNFFRINEFNYLEWFVSFLFKTKAGLNNVAQARAKLFGPFQRIDFRIFFDSSSNIQTNLVERHLLVNTSDISFRVNYFKESGLISVLSVDYVMQYVLTSRQFFKTQNDTFDCGRYFGRRAQNFYSKTVELGNYVQEPGMILELCDQTHKINASKAWSIVETCPKNFFEADKTTLSVALDYYGNVPVVEYMLILESGFVRIFIGHTEDFKRLGSGNISVVVGNGKKEKKIGNLTILDGFANIPFTGPGFLEIGSFVSDSDDIENGTITQKVVFHSASDSLYSVFGYYSLATNASDRLFHKIYASFTAITFGKNELYVEFTGEKTISGWITTFITLDKKKSHIVNMFKYPINL